MEIKLQDLGTEGTDMKPFQIMRILRNFWWCSIKNQFFDTLRQPKKTKLLIIENFDTIAKC